MERMRFGDIAIVGERREGLAFGFTERGGGVSKPPYESLNLGSHVGDDIACVYENRHRVLCAMGAQEHAERLLVPNQVHGDTVVTVSSNEPDAIERSRSRMAAGADAIVCTAPGVPVMLCFADCVPVILTCGNNAFAVVHSGWRGTLARISAKAARALAKAAGGQMSDICAYIGPHILGNEYQVSPDLIETFSLQFATIENTASRMLDLSACIVTSLEEIGVSPCAIHDLQLSTVAQNDRFFSYRQEKGTCGRHAAVAALL